MVRVARRLPGPLIPIVFPGLIAYLLLVLLNADYLRDMGATDVPRNSPHLVYLMMSGQAVWLLFVWAWVFAQVVRPRSDRQSARGGAVGAGLAVRAARGPLPRRAGPRQLAGPRDGARVPAGAAARRSG